MGNGSDLRIAGWLADQYGINTALLLCVPGSWALLWLCWFAFYRTYPKDAARLRAEMAFRRQEIEAGPGEMGSSL